MKFTFQPESKPLDGFTIKRAIDRGGFGEVYYALSDSGKEVALKLLQRNMDIELRGIRQCMNLKHTNLITIFDTKTDGDGDHWVIMEYVAGQTLEQVLDGYPQGMPMEEVLRWLDGIAAGADYLHDRGVVHRDLKPANLFLDAGVVKIGDIGLSKYITPSRRSGHTESVGTVHYMAPEVAHGRYGNELDVYSVAVMTYEMITGTVPFEGGSTGEIIMKHLTEKPDLSRLPEKLRPVIGKALEKDPQQRTHSVEQLARQVKAATRGETVFIKTSPVAMEIPEDSFASVQPKNQTEPPHAKRADAHQEKRHRAERHQHGSEQTTDGHAPGTLWGHSAQNVLWIALAAIVVVSIIGPPRIFLSAFVLSIIGAFGYFIYWLFFVPFKPAQLSQAGREKLRKAADEQLQKGASGASPQAVKTATVEPTAQQTPQPQVRPAKRWRYGQTNQAAALTPLTIRPVALRDRVSSASQSMTLAVAFSFPIIAVIAFLLPELQDPGRLGLFGMTTIVASWLLILPAKMWEGTATDPSIRRLVLLSAGVVVGVIAFGLDQTLLVDVPRIADMTTNDTMFHDIGNQPLFEKTPSLGRMLEYQPTLAGYVVFFAGLFGLRRWWWHTDAFRPKRFRVSSLVLTGILGFLITCVWAFPHGWAALWAVAISAVVQLASTWAPPHVRPAMMEGK